LPIAVTDTQPQLVCHINVTETENAHCGCWWVATINPFLVTFMCKKLSASWLNILGQLASLGTVHRVMTRLLVPMRLIAKLMQKENNICKEELLLLVMGLPRAPAAGAAAAPRITCCWLIDGDEVNDDFCNFFSI
jgi:hypothetical protein